ALGLYKSFFPTEEVAKGDIAIGYGKGIYETAAADVTVKESWLAPTSLLPAGGGMVSTAIDVARFGAALFGGHLLQPSSLSKMLRSSDPLSRTGTATRTSTPRGPMGRT